MTFLLLWPLAGLAFNAGPWWLAVAMALIGATFWSQIEHSLAAQEKPVSGARQRVALALLVLGLFALYAGHVAIAEMVAPLYRSGPSDPTLMRTAPEHVLSILHERMRVTTSTPPQLEHAWQVDYERLWSSPALLVLAFLSIGGAAWTLGAGRTVPAGKAVATLFGSLLVVEILCAILAQGGQLVPVADSMTPRTTMGGTTAVSDRLRIALVERGYTVTSNAIWSTGATERMEVVFADPASPFDRWHVSWSGPQRVLPHAVFVLRGHVAGGAVTVDCDLGDVRPAAPERAAWKQWYEGLAAKL